MSDTPKIEPLLLCPDCNSKCACLEWNRRVRSATSSASNALHVAAVFDLRSTGYKNLRFSEFYPSPVTQIKTDQPRNSSASRRSMKLRSMSVSLVLRSLRYRLTFASRVHRE
jgi:hypothetical protein